MSDIRQTMESSVAALLQDGQAAARAGQRTKARRKFRTALTFDPTNVPALLWLAWLSDDPRAGLAYVARALACDPHNPHAHAALRWARRRATSRAPQEPSSTSVSVAQSPRHRWIRSQVFRRKPGFLVASCLLVILISGILTWSMLDDLPVFAALSPTSTPTPTHTPTPTSTSTHTPSPTPTHTPTLTPTSTSIST
ncbi:MAG: hypothetical protein SWK90_20015, partial [Chloroflexota bacterium]|nr:hypothetical protein [Chloroflexota bacterium]